MNEGPINPSGSQRGAVSTSLLTLTGRAVETPFHRLPWKCLNFDNMPPTVMECDDEDKEKSTSPQHPWMIAQRANTRKRLMYPYGPKEVRN